LARLDLHGGRNHGDRNSIENWFRAVTMRIDRFHSFRRGCPASAVHWLDGSDTTPTAITRIKRSTDEHRSRRLAT
jgi:hypothetical protein